DLDKDLAAAFEDFLDGGLVADAAFVESPAASAAVSLFVVGLGARPVRHDVLVILVLDVTDVEKAIPSYAEVDEDCLDTWLNVDDASAVDVANTVLDAAALDVKFLQHAVLEDCDAAFLWLENVDEHFLLHPDSSDAGREQKQIR